MEKSFQGSALLVTLSSLFFFIPVSISVPFILFHGVQDQCSNSNVNNFTQLLSSLSSSTGYCLEIGDGEDDSVAMTLTQQASVACEKVKNMAELSQGYNIVAQSQGNLVARGVIEFCDNAPPVINYVSLGGPHAGVSEISELSTPLSQIVQELGVYSDYVQDHIAPSNYVKILNDLSGYLEHSKYLPKLNNEKPDERNSTFKDRFSSLNNLVLVMFQNDTVVIPKESSLFGYYPDEASPLLTPQLTKLYTEDWIGLKTLDDNGKVKFFTVPGDHLNISQDDAVKYVVPYLQDQDQPTFSS